MMSTLFIALAGDDKANVVPQSAAEALLPAITSLVVFLIAFGILAVAVWPKILKGLDAREQKIRDEIKSAEEARKQANQALQDYQKALAEAREEANQMIAKARADAKAAAEELRSRNETELGELRQRAAREIDTAKHQAIRELHAESATLAVAIASKILRREISVDDQQALVTESLRELGGVAGGSGGTGGSGGSRS